MTNTIIYADGAAYSNPIGRNSAAAVLVRDGVIVERQAKNLGTGSNNVAEYHALLLALHLARKHGISRPIIRMDSKLVVEQVVGTWKCKSASLAPLRAIARYEIAQFEAVDLGWIPREENEIADEASIDVLEGRMSETAEYDHTTPFGRVLTVETQVNLNLAIEFPWPVQRVGVDIELTRLEETVRISGISEEMAKDLERRLGDVNGWTIHHLGATREILAKDINV